MPYQSDTPFNPILGPSLWSPIGRDQFARFWLPSQPQPQTKQKTKQNSTKERPSQRKT